MFFPIFIRRRDDEGIDVGSILDDVKGRHICIFTIMVIVTVLSAIKFGPIVFPIVVGVAFVSILIYIMGGSIKDAIKYKDKEWLLGTISFSILIIFLLGLLAWHLMKLKEIM